VFSRVWARSSTKRKRWRVTGFLLHKQPDRVHYVASPLLSVVLSRRLDLSGELQELKAESHKDPDAQHDD
jgi:hypothetical protein